MLKHKRSCSNCIRGTAIGVNNDILCRDKGVVSPDYACSRHKFTPSNMSVKDMNYKCISCEYFIPVTGASMEASNRGLCQLFSVRQYDGRCKNACSKFIKKSVMEVS